jgi:hypothetical protein
MQQAASFTCRCTAGVVRGVPTQVRFASIATALRILSFFVEEPTSRLSRIGTVKMLESPDEAIRNTRLRV